MTLALVSVIAACGGSDAADGSSGGNPTALEGTWLKACGPLDSQFPDDGNDIVTITMTGNQFSNSIENYIDAACTQPFSLAPRLTASGVISVGADVTTFDGVVATEIFSRITQSSDPDLFDEVSYDIFYLDGDNLYFGEFEGETPDDRPDALDFMRVFVRQ